MIFIIIFTIIAVVVASTILSIIYVKRKNEEQEKCYNAAFNIIKEDLLDYSIQNSIIHNKREPSGERLMLRLKTIKSKKKDSFVFDPSKGIYIGRRKADNKNIICLNDIRVSQNHCVIYTDGIRMYIQDLNSLNGTVVKRGMKSYFLGQGNIMELKNKDRLHIGAAIFKVTVFYYNAITM